MTGGFDTPGISAEEKHRIASKAASDLAYLMTRELKLAGLDSNSLRLFLLAYWDRVHVLAHAVHDNRSTDQKA